MLIRQIDIEIPLGVTGRAIDVQYLGADDAVCVVFDSGDVVLVRLDTHTVR